MACCPLYAVQTSSVKIIETCGAFKTIARPGLNCLIPFVDNIATTVSMRLQQMEIACETKSRDNVFLTIRVAIQYQVIANDDAIKASYYRLTNPMQQVESYVYDVIRSTVPKINLDDVFTTKEEVAADILENLREAMKDFGYEILSTPITDIDPNREVKNAMNEINKQKRLRVAAEDEGEAVKIRSIKEAEAEAQRTEITAHAEAEAKYLHGQGISRQRQAVMEGLRESCAAFHDEIKSLDPKTVLDLMVVTSYFDMMKDLGAHDKTSAVFMNHSPGALEDLAGAVSKGFMTGLPAAPGFAQPMGRR